MHDFAIQDNALYCEQCRVSQVARKVGTPAYVYSSKTVLNHLDKIQHAFEEYPTLVCYSVKANSNVHILGMMAEKGAGADIVSGGELYRSLQAGIPSSRIIYSGAGKTDDEIEYALKSNIYFFNVESVPELYRIDEVAGKLCKKAKISIRVNPNVDAQTHPYTTTAKKENKFGLSITQIEENYGIAASLPNLEVHGVDVHLGSPILKLDPYLEALGLLGQAVEKLRKGGIHPKVLDLGGGLGIVYKDENAFTAADFAKAVLPKIRDMKLDLILEPGRFIVGNAGILVTRVTYIKVTPVKTFVICDAGMNDLIRPPFYGSYHEIKAAEKVDRETIRADVVGPICESSDFFAKDRDVPKVEAGEYLSIMSAGAYGFTMSSNYNSRPRACEVLVEGNRYRIIRKRESYEDLVRGEV